MPVFFSSDFLSDFFFDRVFVRFFVFGGWPFAMQVMGEDGMLSLGNPPSSGLEAFDSTGCTTSPPEHSFPQRFREVQYGQYATPT